VKELRALAEFVQSRDLADAPPDRFERVKLHIVDSIGARLAGSRTDEGMAVRRVIASSRDDLVSAVIEGCAQARCTEIDDIHLASCTTPGSVVVATALALAREEAHGLRTMRDFAAAALAGYEALVRLGDAIDGPAVLHQHVWPTYFAAAFGSAATACRAFALSVDQTAGALATALAFCSGTAVPAARPSSSRWITLGVAAANGVLAARSAREGLTSTGRPVVARPRRLTSGLGTRYLFDDVGVKPYPIARQALAAVEAVSQIVDSERVEPVAIDEIVVSLPEGQRAIVDRPALPSSRFESIVSVQYQIALALLAPDRLTDVRRTPPFVDARVRRLMSRVRVRRAPELDRRYPRAWPARVDLRTHGRRHRRIVMHPRGDSRNPFEWNDEAQKFCQLAGPILGVTAAEEFVSNMRAARPDTATRLLGEAR
jgi:2-methylcitrate dehydratase PrpD